MIVRHAIEAMGTRFEVALAGLDPDHLLATAEAALAEVEEWDARLSFFRRDSLLSHVNRHAADGPVRVDAETFELLRACAEVHGLSGGAFDVTVAPLMRAWGFRDPGDADVGRARGAVGMGGVHLDPAGGSVRFRRTGMAIDLGGVGKGHALDAAAQVVREEGVACALLHGGTSTVVAIGAPPGTDGWRVALAGAGEMPRIMLRDAALSVSAPHGRTVDQGGVEIGHVIDPRTGRPAESARLAAVIGSSARLADAWSTALLVLGTAPAAMPAAITTLVGRGTDDDVTWTAEGARADLFEVPVCAT